MKQIFRNMCIFLIAISFLFIVGCGITSQVHVKVQDDMNRPVAGAVVETSEGWKATTDKNGMATVQFNGLGIKSVMVAAKGSEPVMLPVIIPVESGQTKIAQVRPLGAKVIDCIDANVSGDWELKLVDKHNSCSRLSSKTINVSIEQNKCALKINFPSRAIATFMTGSGVAWKIEDPHKGGIKTDGVQLAFDENGKVGGISQWEWKDNSKTCEGITEISGEKL